MVEKLYLAWIIQTQSEKYLSLIFYWVFNISGLELKFKPN